MQLQAAMLHTGPCHLMACQAPICASEHQLVFGTCCVCRASRIAARCKRVQEKLAAARQGDGAGKYSGHLRNKSSRLAHRVMSAVMMSWLRSCTILPQRFPESMLYAPGSILCQAGRIGRCPRHRADPVDAQRPCHCAQVPRKLCSSRA